MNPIEPYGTITSFQHRLKVTFLSANIKVAIPMATFGPPRIFSIYSFTVLAFAIFFRGSSICPDSTSTTCFRPTFIHRLREIGAIWNEKSLFRARSGLIFACGNIRSPVLGSTPRLNPDLVTGKYPQAWYTWPG